MNLHISEKSNSPEFLLVLHWSNSLESKGCYEKNYNKDFVVFCYILLNFFFKLPFQMGMLQMICKIFSLENTFQLKHIFSGNFRKNCSAEFFNRF